MRIEPTGTKLLRYKYAKALHKLLDEYKKRAIDLANFYYVNNIALTAFYEAVSKSKKKYAWQDELNNDLNTLANDFEKKADGVVAENTNNAYNKGIRDANGKLPPNMRLPVLTPIDREAIHALHAQGFALVKNVSNDFKSACFFAISNGIIQGEDIKNISRLIVKKAKISKNRATAIARTEVIRAYNTAHYNRFKAVGVKKYEWIAAWSERTCPECGDLDGRIFVLNGNPIPPLHTNCRCTIAPVIE